MVVMLLVYWPVMLLEKITELMCLAKKELNDTSFETKFLHWPRPINYVTLWELPWGVQLKLINVKLNKIGVCIFLNGPFQSLFIFIFRLFVVKNCWWLDSNPGSLDSEVTALVTLAQPLCNVLPFIIIFVKNVYGWIRIVKRRCQWAN